MPKANSLVARMQQQLLSMCDLENSQIAMSTDFVECMTNFQEDPDPELAADGLFGELRLTRQNAVPLDRTAPLPTRSPGNFPARTFN